MTIRPMTRADAPAVASLSTQLSYDHTPTSLIAERLGSFAPDHGCYVAEQGGAVVGWVEVFGVHMLISARFFAEIGGLVVDMGARRQGVGRSLMVQAEAWAQGHGYSEVRLRSGLHRAEAHEFYQSVGYELAKTSHMFRKVLTPLLLGNNGADQQEGKR